MLRWISFVVLFCLIYLHGKLFAENFYLDSPKNKGTLRFEIDNDVIWDDDSNFTNGWSLQYHTVRCAGWEETKMPGFIKWVGKHFPTLNNDGSIVRNSHGIGQNMITPKNLNIEIPQEGELPYAGTLTYTINWQSYNRQMARNLQLSIGVLGPESLAEQFQKFVHNDLGAGEDPKGWHAQRKAEPIFNIGYEHPWRMAHLGNYTNDWAGQLTLIPSVSLGNLFTAVELGMAIRFGWNILEGFNAYPAPPGRGFFQASHLPKPSSASPHAFEVVLGARGCGLIYSVIYDGSVLTDDNRSIDRYNYVLTGGVGLFYHHYGLCSVRITLQKSTDLIDRDSIPAPPTEGEKTHADVSFGSLIIDFHF
jgi:hypothetical protein